LRSFSLIAVWLCVFLSKEFWRKSCLENVDEVDYRGQFHQPMAQSINEEEFTKSLSPSKLPST